MARLRADKKNYKKAFDVHFHAYKNWSTGCVDSRRLIMCYCVECGLKCLIMEDNKIYQLEQANQETKNILTSHDFRILLKAVKRAGTYKFKDFQTEYGETVTADNYHQLCRYCIRAKNNNMEPIEEFDKTVDDIAEWLKEVI